MACTGGPDISDPENNDCLFWVGSALEWTVNIAGEEWLTDQNQFWIGHLKPGTYDTYICAADGSDTPNRFKIRVPEEGKPIILKE